MEGNLVFEDRGEKEEERTRNKTRFSREKVSFKASYCPIRIQSLVLMHSDFLICALSYYLRNLCIA